MQKHIKTFVSGKCKCQFRPCRKGYLNKYLSYDFQIFRSYSIEPDLCDKLEELN